MPILILQLLYSLSKGLIRLDSIGLLLPLGFEEGLKEIVLAMIAKGSDALMMHNNKEFFVRF